MPLICPSLTYSTAVEYTAYMDKLAGFATRVHIDVSDGVLAPVRSIGLPQAWWPESIIADVHMMYARPLEHTEQLVSMKPNLVVVHPEAVGDLRSFGEHLQRFSIRFGIVWMPGVPLDTLEPLLAIADHVLIFSGKLGYYGGHADPARFEEARSLRRRYHGIEIGWDGGANDTNVNAIGRAGIDVINVGSGLSKTANPAAAYAKLMNEIGD